MLLKLAVSITAESRISAVSYTHLDVYKRQLHTVGGGGWAEESPCVPLPAWGIPDFLRQRVLWSGSFRQKKRLFLTILHADSAANAAETPPFGRQTALLRAGSGVCVQNSKKQLSFFEMKLSDHRTRCRRKSGTPQAGRGTCLLYTSGKRCWRDNPV